MPKHRKRFIAMLLGTALGAGLVPVAPGTMGTLVSVPLAYYSNDWPIYWRIILWGSLTLIGIWAARVIDETMKSSDNSIIVIDEVVGFGITAWSAGRDFKTLVLAFVLFRFFDILKPFPVRQVDRWSKKQASRQNLENLKQGASLTAWASKWAGGFGVMADDVIAGFQGFFVIWLLKAFHLLH